MASQYYSEGVQLEILEEIVQNQGTTETVDKDTPEREWNYDFLCTQGYIKREYSPPIDSHGRPNESGMLVGEELTDAGKLWRSTLYDRLLRERVQSQHHQEQQMENQVTRKIQKAMLWMTRTILVLTALLVLPLLWQALLVLWQVYME